MDIDQHTASALGFPKRDYVSVERERRWLCHEVPRERIARTESISDLYVTGGRLRLTRKADVNAHTRLITSIYLTEEEFAVLAASLPGARIKKLRHRLQSVPGAVLAVDEFQGEHSGLILAEAEFETPEQMADFPTPDFVVREVTLDPRFGGGHLVEFGLPPEIR